jgi:group I intron endonuclease
MKKSGVYQIRNIITNQIYIGGTLDLQERYINHGSELKHNKHHSIHLQNSFNKYGGKNFVFEILEECDSDWNIIINKENYYLNQLGKADELIKGENKLFYELTYNIKPYAQRGFFGKHSKETIELMIKNNPLRKNIICYKDKQFIAKYISCKDASDNTKISKSAIFNLCKNKTYISKKGYMFCFEEDVDLMIKDLDKKFITYNKGKVYTQEELIKRNFNNSHIRKIKVIELDANIEFNKVKEIIFNTQLEVSKYYNIQPYLICKYLKENKIYKKKQLKFSYYNDIV